MALDFPPEASRAISQKYADILRVGRMKLNNEIIEWPGSVDEKIQEFQTAWVAGVKANLMTKSFDDISLLRFGYLYCKLVSINFVIADVMAVLQKKTGVMCSVETVDPKSGAHLAEFGASIVPGPQLKAWVAWPGQDNIIHRDPKKGQRVVKGTLSRLETRVKLPIEPGVVPDYTLKMMLKKANSKESGPSEDVAMRASSQLEEQGESLWWESLQKKLETPTAEKAPSPKVAQNAAIPVPKASTTQQAAEATEASPTAAAKAKAKPKPKPKPGAMPQPLPGANSGETKRSQRGGDEDSGAKKRGISTSKIKRRASKGAPEESPKAAAAQKEPLPEAAAPAVATSAEGLAPSKAPTPKEAVQKLASSAEAPETVWILLNAL
eukprot:TRINITY_DN13602_c0_g1_i4.p1 TRINITY_DN13602_c0_g1~~TRINITY_DN13602_c0_g1_i4.p1  ORF type:complete len:380 (+),score=101.33 TRINITY_DN13602_c0_g1_i4:75-1214(+)